MYLDETVKWEKKELSIILPEKTCSCAHIRKVHIQKV